MNIRELDDRCVHCSGVIMEKFEYIPARNVAEDEEFGLIDTYMFSKRHVAYYCSKCGTLFEFLPETDNNGTGYYKN